MILKNATVLTVDNQNTILTNSDVKIEDNKIVEIGTELSGENEVDCTGKVIMPGFVNCHAHMPMTIFRSLAEEDNDRLKKYVFPIEGKFITPQNVQIATDFSLLETIASGQTTIADMYYYDKEIADCFKAANVRMVACETIIDEGGETFNTELGRLEHFENLDKEYSEDELINVCIAPHAPYTNSLEMLKQCKQISDDRNIPLMIHVSEMKFEEGEYKGSPSVVQYLEKNDLLDSKTILVHTLYLEDEDYAIIAKHGCKVAHCPVSNAKGGRKTLNLKAMQDNNITVGFGTDGAMSGNRMDFHSTLYFASKMHKHTNLDRGFLKNYEVIRMATIESAKVLGLDGQIGSIEVGKQADLIVIDTNMPNMMPVYDVESAIVNTLDTTNIEMTIVNGKVIYQNGKYLTIDKDQVLSKFMKLTDEIVEFIK